MLADLACQKVPLSLRWREESEATGASNDQSSPRDCYQLVDCLPWYLRLCGVGPCLSWLQSTPFTQTLYTTRHLFLWLLHHFKKICFTGIKLQSQSDSGPVSNNCTLLPVFHITGRYSSQQQPWLPGCSKLSLWFYRFHLLSHCLQVCFYVVYAFIHILTICLYWYTVLAQSGVAHPLLVYNKAPILCMFSLQRMGLHGSLALHPWSRSLSESSGPFLCSMFEWQYLLYTELSKVHL